MIDKRKRAGANVYLSVSPQQKGGAGRESLLVKFDVANKRAKMILGDRGISVVVCGFLQIMAPSQSQQPPRFRLSRERGDAYRVAERGCLRGFCVQKVGSISMSVASFVDLSCNPGRATVLLT